MQIKLKILIPFLFLVCAKSHADAYSDYVRQVLGKVETQHVADNFLIAAREGYYPDVQLNKLQGAPPMLLISRGVFATCSSEDELAFLIVRALSRDDKKSKRQVEEDAIQRFIETTPYNPTAAISYYERVITLLNAAKSYKLDLGHSAEEMMVAKEYAKIAIEDTAWSKIDLSERLEAFQPFFPQSVLRTPTNGLARITDYLGLMHHFYGPNYQAFIDWNKEHPIFLVGVAMIAISPILYKAFSLVVGANNLVVRGIATTARRVYAAAPNENSRIWSYGVGSLSALQAAGVGYAVYETYYIPPRYLKEHVEKLANFHLKLDGIKDLTKETFFALFEELDSFRTDAYWLDPSIQKGFMRIFDLAIANGIKLNRSDRVLVRQQNIGKISYLLLAKIGQLLNYEKRSKDWRLSFYEEARSLSKAAVATLYLMNTQPEMEDEKKEFSKAIAVVRSQWDQFAHRSLPNELAATHCMLFFQQGGEKMLSEIILDAKRDESSKNLVHRIQVCLANEIAKNTQYKYVVKQRALLKKHFYESPSALRLADERIAYFVTQFDDVKDFVKHVEESLKGDFDAFEVGSANGEALLSKPDMVRDLDGVKAVLASDYFWSREVDRSSMNEQAQRAMQDLRRAAKGYNIELTESIHGLLVEKIKLYGTQLALSEQLDLWRSMVRRGTSVHSDAFFKSIYAQMSEDERDAEIRGAAENGFLHDQNVVKTLVKKEVTGVLAAGAASKIGSAAFIQGAARYSIRALGVSLAHRDVMEYLSEKMESSAEESRLIEEWKTNRETVKEDIKDDGIDLLVAIIQETRNWEKERQWEFLLFLVGHSANLSKESRGFLVQFSMTPKLMRERFMSLPHTYQYKIVDAMLSQKDGLLENCDPSEQWTKHVTNYFVDMVGDNAKDVVRELFDAYFHALNTPGLKYFKTTLFAQLFVSSKGEKHSSDVIAKVCQHFGAFGIKLGQFLLATGILPKAENEALRHLEDDARAPTREEIYRDLRDIFGGNPIPYKIKHVAGGASLKYVVLATKDDGSQVALKILARDALIHTPLEEKIMKRIATYLVDKHGQRYGVFKTAVFAAAQAVRRELSFEQEVAHSELARQYMYQNCDQGGVSIRLAKERLIHPRLIEAEFAPGTSIYGLSVDAQDKIARALLGCEDKNFFGVNGQETTYFDPDRHFGNYRMTTDVIAPIDFGQLHVMSPEQRERLIDLSALSGILANIAKNSSVALRMMLPKLVIRMQAVLGVQLDDAREKTLARKLAAAFMLSVDDSAVTSFYRLLSVLDEEGLLQHLGDERIALYDVPKGLLQLSRLGEYVQGEPVQTVEGRFKELVTKRAEHMVQELRLKAPSWTDIAKYFLWMKYDGARDELEL